MQIQRVIEESMRVGENKKEDKKLKNFVVVNNEKTMKVPITVASTSTPEVNEPITENSFVTDAVSANRSFLHGQEGGKVVGNINERVIYATLDSLALKRARLPLQLVPIDDNAVSSEKKDKNVGEKKINSSKKTTPKRPSFKIRSGVSVPVQWKSRARSTPHRPQTTAKLENVSKDLASKLIIFENIIRNNNRACEILCNESTTRNASNKEVPVVPEPNENLDEHSNANRSNSQRDSFEKNNPGSEANTRRESIVKNDKSELEKTVKLNEEKESKNLPRDDVIQETILPSAGEKKIVEFVETQRPGDSSIGKQTFEEIPISLPVELSRGKSKRRKSEFAFAKNVLHSLPISSVSRRSKKMKNSSKSRQSNLESSNLEISKNKSFSREDLRYVTISLPTNFVHLASATKSKLLPTLNSIETRLIEHEEKCAELEYIGLSNYQEIEKFAGSRKSVRNSLIDVKRSRSQIDGNFAKSSLAGGCEEAAAASSSSLSSAVSSSSSSSSRISSVDNANYTSNPAKVLTLENSQGVPEVVKRSENEGIAEETQRETGQEEKVAEERSNHVDEEIVAPVYEAMSEFSISRTAPGILVAETLAASRAANASFLWGGRASRRYEEDSLRSRDKEDIVEFRERSNDVETIDNSIRDNGYDAYDDVGLSREDTEEDHYDDVGPPPAVTKNSSTDTLFEKIDSEVDCELYDDVVPISIVQSSFVSNPSKEEGDPSSTTIDTSNLRKDEKSKKIDTQTHIDIPSNRSLENCEISENDENQYLSISNDYSSVEEGLDDFENGQDDALYDDVELPSQERVNSLYAGSSSGSQLGSLYNGKESEWEDLEEAAPELPLPKKNNAALRNLDSQVNSSKKKTIQRWSRKVRRQKSKASRKNPSSRSTSRTAVARGTSTFSVAVSLGTGSVLLVGSGSTTDNNEYHASNVSHRPSATNTYQESCNDDERKDSTSTQQNAQLQTRGLVQLRILGRPDDTVDTQETSCYVLEDTASDDSNYETLGSFLSDEFSSGSEDEESSIIGSANQNGISSGQSPVYGVTHQEAPSRPVPPPPRESSLTETFGKRMKMLRRTWSITKGSLGRMRRRTSASAENDGSADDGLKYSSNDQQSPNNDGRKYFSFKKHFRKSLTGLSTFYLDNETGEERLSRNNNRSSKEEIYNNGSNNSWYTGTDYWKNNVTEQSQRNDIDHYSMLDEEPLYQFYAAAAARVAFESDSEGYEEVEDPMPSPITADLAKPGHRTLWCQTPQVINSDLLQRLSPDEKKVQEAKFEIFTSEASYLNSLRVLVDEFLNNHELVYEVLTPSEREKLFGGVPSVLIASERLLAELETVWREDVMMRGLPEVLLNYAQRSSSVYVAYCSNQVSIDTTLKELRNKKGSKFVETVTRIQTHPACQSLSLHSFLMLPMQRVTRLPLLADAVLSKLPSDSKEERTCWECVLSQFSQVVMECNEGARAAGRLAEMEALERKLEYSSKVPPIALRDRYLVRRGPVVQMLARADAEYKLTFGKKYHKASLYLLLLTDYLLIAKTKTNTNEETYTVIDTCKRSLVALEKVPEDSPFAGRSAMVLSLLENYSGRHVEYILTCNNATERERWLDAISPPKPSLVGETLYETWDCPQVMALYPYAAAQPDELTLQPGDVINVLRKMTDGWHLGEKLLGGEQGWFPGNYAKEVASEHVRARNLRQRHRLLALSASVMQQIAKQSRAH